MEKTTNPSEATVFVLPNDLQHYTNEQLRALPYLAGNERRHVFLAITENPERTVGIPAIIFRCDFNRFLLEAGDTTTRVWGWPSDDLYDANAKFERDIFFQGQAGATGLTIRACQSIEKSELSAHINILHTFYGIYEVNQPDYAKQLRQQFIQLMRTSRLCLCASTKPEHVIRYRFYEALATGRIPVLVGDYSLRALEDRIDYSKCSLWIPEKDVDNIGNILKEWLNNHPDEELLEMGKYGYAAWKEWLNPQDWGKNWERLVIEKLKEIDG
jgi:glycosyltransferase involved in cell wall biosynthesis